MSSIFLEYQKDHFIRSELIKGFFKQKEVIGFAPAESPIIKREEQFYFIIEGVGPTITTEECYNNFIELLKRKDMLKRSF